VSQRVPYYFCQTDISGGNNFNDFPDNQMIKFRVVKAVKVNQNQYFPPSGCRIHGLSW